MKRKSTEVNVGPFLALVAVVATLVGIIVLCQSSLHSASLAALFSTQDELWAAKAKAFCACRGGLTGSTYNTESYIVDCRDGTRSAGGTGGTGQDRVILVGGCGAR